MKAWTLWITGLPGSGKSTLAHTLHSNLKTKDISAQILSSDELRKVMTPKPAYSEEERDTVYATLVLIAKLLNQNGINVIIDATGNLRRYRDLAHRTLKNFVIVYAKCDLKVCIKREQKRRKRFSAPKKIYDKGLSGRSTTVPGLNVPYEEPIDADITVRTDEQPTEESAQEISNFILNFLKAL